MAESLKNCPRNSAGQSPTSWSKFDHFLLDPQVRTFSGTVPGTFRNTDVENREPSGDCSQNNPHPEVELSACRVSNLTDSDPEDTSHMVTGVRKEITFAPLGLFSENKRSCAPPPQRLKPTRFCWPFNNWQVTVTLSFSLLCTCKVLINCRCLKTYPF